MNQLRGDREDSSGYQDVQALTDCASEQLHLSGRIQAHGALLAADLHDGRITYASANIGEWVGAGPEGLFDSSLMTIFAPEEARRLEDAIEQTAHHTSSPDLYGMRLTAVSDGAAPGGGPGGMVDVILHRSGGQIVIEMERAHPDDQADRNAALFAAEAMGAVSSVSEVESAVASTLRAMTGFDRVMVYRFHDDEHGEVVAEDCLPGLVRYLGHHFPASDIPPPARQIYIRKPSRFIPDVDEGDVAVVPSPRMAGTILDLSHAALRSVSPFHLEYMRNMNTAASASFSMVVGGRLTRMVSCISESPRWLLRARRRTCELAVLQAKVQIAAAEQISALSEAARRGAIRPRIRAAMHRAPAIVEGLASASGDLLELCRADGAVACFDGQYRSIGAVRSEGAVRRLIGEIGPAGSPDAPWATDRLQPSNAEFLGVAGCMVVTFDTPGDFLVWFRRERAQQLRWLGDPNAHSAGSLNPRKSFDTWVEEVTGSCEPWTAADLSAARSVAHDVESAQLSLARAAQRGSEATFAAVFANAPIGIAVVGLDGTFQRVNQALCAITGYPERELTELTFQDITHPDDLDIDVNEATRLLYGEISSYQMDKRYFAKGGHLIWVRLSGSIVRDKDGQPLHFIAHIEDISARKRDEELLRRQATRDPLTGVFNRSRFEEELDRFKSLVRRHGYRDEAAVFMIDVDGLKKVNDRDGHAAGDDYLKSVAHTISRRLRLTDVFARIGGDEFAALLPHTAVAEAQKLARTLVEQVKANSCGSVCIGVAMITPDQLDDALERADQAMYQAKRQGGGHSYGP